MFCNQPESFGHVRIGKLATEFRRFTAREKDPPRFVCLLNPGFISHPVVVYDLWHCVTMFSVVDCWSKKILPGQNSEALMCLAPSFYSAGNRDAVDAITRHRCDPVFC